MTFIIIYVQKFIVYLISAAIRQKDTLQWT